MTEELSQEVFIDEAKIAELQKQVDKKASELSDKSYAVSMTNEDLEVYSTLINEVEWRGKEALGILEIAKKIEDITKEGIKNNAVFMNALQIEATHYFLNKFSGKGNLLASKFIKVFKSFEQALGGISQDNKELDDLRKELAAAQQGLESE
jgi:hypothetical protein